MEQNYGLCTSPIDGPKLWDQSPRVPLSQLLYGPQISLFRVCHAAERHVKVLPDVSGGQSDI